MVWEVAKRRGHVAQGPAVAGPWSGLDDMNTVTGWLLWSHRMASPYGGMTGRAFAAAARERGIHLSETEVSRAETGERDVAIGAIAKYERMLGMRSGALSAPLRSAARLAPAAPGSDKLAVLRTVPRTQDARQQVVDDFYLRYIDGEHFLAHDWLHLIDAITGRDNSLLPDALVDQWIRILLDETMRAVNGAYFTRIEALSTLAESGRHGMHLLDAVRELTAVRGVSGAPDAWSVVGDIQDPQVVDALIAELPSVPDHRFIDYALALTMPAYRDDLSARQAQDITTELTRRLDVWSLGSYEAIAALAAELPRSIGASILARIDRIHPLSRLTGPRADRHVDHEIRTYVHAAMARTWPSHPHGSVLPELLRVALGSEHSGFRHHAATLIACSPFAAAICDAAADLCGPEENPLTRQLAIYLVSRLATPDNDERLRLLLKQDGSRNLTANTLAGMAHAGLLTEQDDLLPYMRDKDFRYIAIYAAGITHHPHLYSAEADSDWAAWWRDKRGGVWE